MVPRRQLLAALAAPLLPGCALLMPPPPTRVPMEVLADRAPCAAEELLVMLPGAYSRPQEFFDEGFVAEVRRRGLAADIAVADAHMGYFVERSVLTRLREDIVRPARARGYRRIRLVGISLGGFVALAYAARHGSERGGEIDGVLVLAPYLGRRTLQQQIAAAGGPAAWRAQLPPSTEEDPDRDLWLWLATRPTSPPVMLGYGREDRYAEAHRLLVPLLPAGASFDAEGGHDWPAWRALWSAWLDRGLVAAVPGCVR